MQVGVKRTTWDNVSHAQPIDVAMFKHDSEECCNFDELDWNNLKCSMQNFMKPNYTARYLTTSQTALTHNWRCHYWHSVGDHAVAWIIRGYIVLTCCAVEIANKIGNWLGIWDRLMFCLVDFAECTIHSGAHDTMAGMPKHWALQGISEFVFSLRWCALAISSYWLSTQLIQLFRDEASRHVL